MAFDARKLRIWFAAGAVVVLLSMLGFYSYARYRINKTITKIPEKLGIEVQQSTAGFTFSKTEGGKTLFTLSAGKAVQYKEGQKVALNDVRIIVYGRDKDDQYDQIFGRQFAYDPKSGEVTAQGEVQIDIEATGKPDPDPLKSPPGSIHLKTSNLSFNRNTGVAQTSEALEFAIPQASGSARGAVYDSKELTLALKSDVKLQSHQTTKGVKPITVDAASALIAERTGEATFHSVKMSQTGKQMNAEKVLVKMREDNSIEKITANGGVTAKSEGKSSVDLRAGLAEFDLGEKSQIRSAQLSGNVAMTSAGAQQFSANSGKILLAFGADNVITKARALDNASLQQTSSDGKTSEIKSQAIDFFFNSSTPRAKNKITRAETSGASELRLTQPDGSKTVVTAAKFEGAFDAQSRIKSLHGSENVKVVASAANAPDRVTTSREVTAQFDTASKNGGISSITQEGDFKYQEGQRTGSAERAQYSATNDVLTFSGSPRIDDKASGLSVSAETLRLNRKTGDISADRNVKTTYVDTKAQSGAMFSGTEPIHATGAAMMATRQGSSARFSGGARLWQGANIIQSPVIVFDKTNRTLNASGGQVQTVFVQTDKNGKVTPVQVTAQKLEYSDQTRKARFSGGVIAKSADATVNADHVDITLRQKNESQGSQASQVREIVAEGKLTIEQQSPVRKAIGERLVYTPEDGKFVLTGTKEKPPSIFDAEQGDLTADSLTFYSHDDRVQVTSGSNTRTVTRTRIKNESRP